MSDSDTTRSLVIIYGFFFVLLSAMLNIALNSSILSPRSTLATFMLAWIMALSSMMVGTSIVTDLSDHLRPIGLFGLILMNIAVPLGYMLLVTTLLGFDEWIIPGTISYVIVPIPIFIYSKWKMRKPKP